jgi:hypothetical protein
MIHIPTFSVVIPAHNEEATVASVIEEVHCRDINCGFKIFRRTILDHVTLSSDGASIDTELLAGAKARGYRIAEVKVTHLPRTAGRATGVDAKVILRAFRDLSLFKIRLNREVRKEK